MLTIVPGLPQWSTPDGAILTYLYIIIYTYLKTFDDFLPGPDYNLAGTSWPKIPRGAVPGQPCHRKAQVGDCWQQRASISVCPCSRVLGIKESLPLSGHFNELSRAENEPSPVTWLDLLWQFLLVSSCFFSDSVEPLKR